MYLSASRSYLFNQMLAQRVTASTWDNIIEGEVFGFSGSLRGFTQEGTEEELSRFEQKDIHPTCALWGRGNSLAETQLLEIEKDVANSNTLFSEGIEKQGMKQERRATRLLLPELSWEWLETDVLELKFELASGLFATSVLRELGHITEAPRPEDEHQAYMHRKAKEQAVKGKSE